MTSAKRYGFNVDPRCKPIVIENSLVMPVLGLNLLSEGSFKIKPTS